MSNNAYKSAKLENDSYTTYPNIPVTTITNGKQLNYIQPAEISPARKAHVEELKGSNTITALVEKTTSVSVNVTGHCVNYSLIFKLTASVPEDVDFETLSLEKFNSLGSEGLCTFINDELNTNGDLEDDAEGAEVVGKFIPINYTDKVTFTVVVNEKTSTITI